MLVLLAIAAVMLFVAKSSDDAPSSSTTKGDDGVYMSCEEAIEHLPEAMRFSVAAAIYTGTDSAKLLELANALETAGNAQPDPYLRAALLIAAHCARDRAVAAGAPTAAPAPVTSSGATGPSFAPTPSPPAPSPTPAPGPSSTVASSPSSSSFVSSSSTVPSSTADGSAPIFGRMDASEHAARVGTTYAATAQPGNALRR